MFRAAAPTVSSQQRLCAAALPVQVYLWAESSERGFVELTAAAIMVILVFLVLMNLLAVIFHKKF